MKPNTYQQKSRQTVVVYSSTYFRYYRIKKQWRSNLTIKQPFAIYFESVNLIFWIKFFSPWHVHDWKCDKLFTTRLCHNILLTWFSSTLLDLSYCTFNLFYLSKWPNFKGNELRIPYSNNYVLNIQYKTRKTKHSQPSRFQSSESMKYLIMQTDWQLVK